MRVQFNVIPLPAPLVASACDQVMRNENFIVIFIHQMNWNLDHTGLPLMCIQIDNAEDFIAIFMTFVIRNNLIILNCTHVHPLHLLQGLIVSSDLIYCADQVTDFRLFFPIPMFDLIFF